MSKLHIRRFQDLVGRTDLLRVFQNLKNEKTQLLDFSAILKSAASHNDPKITSVGVSVPQDFELDKRLVNYYLNIILIHRVFNKKMYMQLKLLWFRSSSLRAWINLEMCLFQCSCFKVWWRHLILKVTTLSDTFWIDLPASRNLYGLLMTAVFTNIACEHFEQFYVPSAPNLAIFCR